MDGVQVSHADAAVVQAVWHLQQFCVILYPPPSFYTIQKQSQTSIHTNPVQIMSITLTFCENFRGSSNHFFWITTT